MNDLGLPWTAISMNFLRISRDSQIWETTMAKQMNIGPYCQGQNCTPLNVLFSHVYITLILLGVPLLEVCNQKTVDKNCDFQALYVKISCKWYIIRPWLGLLLTVNRISHECPGKAINDMCITYHWFALPQAFIHALLSCAYLCTS